MFGGKLVIICWLVFDGLIVQFVYVNGEKCRGDDAVGRCSFFNIEIFVIVGYPVHTYVCGVKRFTIGRQGWLTRTNSDGKVVGDKV